MLQPPAREMTSTISIPQEPLRFDATSESLLVAAQDRKQRATQAVQKVLLNVKPSNATFKNSILPLIEAENERIHNDPPISFYSSVSLFEETRNASREAEKLLSDAMADLLTRQEVYDLVAAVLNSPKEIESLDTESLFYLSKLQYSLVESGFGIPAGLKRDRYHEIRKQIGRLKIDISKNFSKEKEGIWLTRDDLEGLSEGLLGRLRQEEPDRFWVELNSSTAFAIRSEVTKSATRKLVYIKDAHCYAENVSLVRELILLRDEAARLLGYASHAAFRLQPNLVSTPEEVDIFLEEFHTNIAPHIQQSVQELVAVKKEYLTTYPQKAWDDPDKIFLWDINFYRRLLQKKKFQYDENLMKEYFPLERTVLEMLGMLQSLFHVRFESVETKSSKSLIWQEDVLMYRVWNAEQRSGAFLGYFYYDLYRRPGKSNQCIAFSLQKVRTALLIHCTPCHSPVS
jgi:metallopeptidase MepB